LIFSCFVRSEKEGGGSGSGGCTHNELHSSFAARVTLLLSTIISFSSDGSDDRSGDFTHQELKEVGLARSVILDSGKASHNLILEFISLVVSGKIRFSSEGNSLVSCSVESETSGHWHASVVVPVVFMHDNLVEVSFLYLLGLAFS